MWYLQEDIQLETGEYFLSDKKKQAKKWHEKQEKQLEKTAENKRKRDAAFVPPKVRFWSSFCWLYPSDKHLIIFPFLFLSLYRM